MSQVVIIDTGCANIASVKYALERLTGQVSVSDDPKVIQSADRLILPGVGSANAAMHSIQAKCLQPCIQALSQPVLGVCLGMQLMVTESQETAQQHSGSLTPCLDLMPGTVERMRVEGLNQATLRLPHMGWNGVTALDHSSLFRGIPNGSYFYFVHSFAVAPYPHTLATCDYGGNFSAALQRDNFFGVQFHPERSGEAGATLLENFLAL